MGGPYKAVAEWGTNRRPFPATDKRVETLLGCHERAFCFFGRVPPEVLYDNIRPVVTDRQRYGPGLQSL